MPLQTFLNLSPQRRDEIINTGLEEFALNDYRTASIAKMLVKLKLARGSFYRYFKDKKALFYYLLDFTGKQIEELFDHYFKNSEKDFFTAWIEYNFALFALEKSYPFIIRFGFKLRSQVNDPIFKAYYKKSKKQKADMITEIIAIHQQRGSIRKDLDITILSVLFHRMESALIEHLSLKYSLDIGWNEKNTVTLLSLSPQELEKELEIFAGILKRIFTV